MKREATTRESLGLNETETMCEKCTHEEICRREQCGEPYCVICSCFDFEAKRPHGEWIFTGRHNVYGGAEIECSNCHTKLMVSMSRWEIGENFCDVCGSRNKKEGERK